ncbi:helix-turn-helix transcriptional regulator [Bacillus sp. 03113]|uniref:helix-turn-helix transcriptional regulator n=1 Tax=Bacillus sp. 03113 TaxID=2578211 RepID=UPI0011439FB5
MYKVGKCKLSDLLKSRDLTQQQLAEILHISKSTVSEYANDKYTMSYERAMNISAILGCAMEDLYERVAGD